MVEASSILRTRRVPMLPRTCGGCSRCGIGAGTVIAASRTLAGGSCAVPLAGSRTSLRTATERQSRRHHLAASARGSD
jgi:hypothetical protein